MRDMQEMGMNIENCELWLSRAALAIAAVLFTFFVIRVRRLVDRRLYYGLMIRDVAAPFPPCRVELLHQSCTPLSQLL